MKTYRKNHLSFLSSYKLSQVRQKEQQKTFESVFLCGQISGPLKRNEYESMRRILSRKLSRLLRFSLVQKPTVQVTKKPKEMRMGKGKGAEATRHIPVTCGQTVVRISWCHDQFLSPLLSYIKRAAKKSKYRFFL